MNKILKIAIAALTGLSMAGAASAAIVEVNNPIDTSVTWTSDNTYRLKEQVYVKPGATLTIEAGTHVMSLPADQGSLAVCRGAKIYVNGTENAPVIMTSSNDNLTSWQELVNEWGNLTLMGEGLISASHYKGNPVQYQDGSGSPIHTNTKVADGLNKKVMEGLTPAFAGDPDVIYGGDNDNDDSGSIRYLSLRYGGKVVGLANELNGLSLGAIGRATDIDHIDIMNNVDDGIEIWGGAVNLKYVSIWNIGDDSFDLDEGWRGKAQFGLIVQGYSADAAQGSGVGDNAIEHDGAEDSDAQPVTTGTMYNFTVIGQPGLSPTFNGGDGATAWRDNCRMQHRNSVFMDCGEKLVRLDNVDGDGAQGYGYNGTLSWADTWTTDYTHSHDWASTINHTTPEPAPGSFNSLDELYQAHTSGKLAEIVGSVFYNNNQGSAYTESDNVGVTVSGGSNPALDNIVAGSSPIVSISREAFVVRGGKDMARVISLDPRANNDAASLVSASPAPADGFFTPAPYRGAFSPTKDWTQGWTAADQFGIMSSPDNPDDPDSAEIQLTASTFFQTEDGIAYTVEESEDNENWSPVGTIVGDGSIVAITDLDVFDNAKFYRAITQ